MNFNSLAEYFYKLYNICLLLMFVPVAGFLYVYQLVLTHQLQPTIQSEQVTKFILILFPVLAFLDLTIVHWVVGRRLSKLSQEPSLGVRLEKYVSMATIRISASVATSLFMAAGLYMTNHEYFSIYFLVIILWTAYHWPTPKRVCRDYKLKGDEEKMVMTKGDAFK
jgi:hypothetical protein